MIRIGSQVDLIVPWRAEFETLVRPGDTVMRELGNREWLVPVLLVLGAVFWIIRPRIARRGA